MLCEMITHIYVVNVHCRIDIHFCLCDILIFLVIHHEIYEYPYQNRVSLIIHVNFINYSLFSKGRKDSCKHHAKSFLNDDYCYFIFKL